MPSPALKYFSAMSVAAGLALPAIEALAEDKQNAFTVPAGLGTLKHPEDNPIDPAKVELGKQLYFDPRLSVDNTVSCATCHNPEKGWSDGRSTSEGVDGKLGGRNAPTVINAAFNRFQFWDGRAATLEAQALGPIENPVEMNLPIEKCIEKLNGIEGYRTQFQAVFGTDVTKENLAKAIAAYERTILSGDAPYDQYKAGNKAALSEQAEAGMKLFFGKANCSACHSGPNFSDSAFHNIGMGMDKSEPDKGRVEISKLAGDTGAFKTPTLREIARSAPYMHDGSLATLEEVVDYYNRGGTPNTHLDEEIYELELTDQEKSQLVTFLKESLSSKSYPLHEAPKLPE